MAQVMIDNETKEIKIKFSDSDIDTLIFEKTSTMIDNIVDDFQAQVIAMALQGYVKTTQFYELFAKRTDLEF